MLSSLSLHDALPILSHQGTSAEAFSANQFIKTDSTFGQANVQVDATKKLVGQFLRQSKSVPVVTGFIGSDSHNRITTLGRSGSRSEEHTSELQSRFD